MNTDRTALNCIIAIIEDKGFANLVLKEHTASLSAQDVKSVYATVYTTLEHLLYVDYMLSFYCKRQKRIVRNILRMSVAKGLFMNTPAYAATSNAVELCKKTGKAASSGLVNAVLKKMLSCPNALPDLPTDAVKRISIQYSYPEWIVQYFSDALGIENAQRLICTPPTGMELRAQYPFSTEELKKLLPSDAACGTLDDNCLRLSHGIDIASMQEFIDGKIAVQSQGSMVICRALGDTGGKTVLDACAAPGGKSAYLYSLSSGTTDLTCFELHSHRVELIKQTLGRLHVKAAVEQRDATVLEPKYLSSFDYVLIDAPCSGLGLLNEKIDVRFNKCRDDIDTLAKLQRSLLNVCCQYVKAGGTLVYSTCTISPLENDVQVNKFLEEHDEFSLSDMRQLLPHIDGVDGFFYAVMKKCI